MREINFYDSGVSKFAILTAFSTYECGFSEFLHFVRAEIDQTSQFRASEIIKIPVFDSLHFAKVDFTQKWVTEIF